MLRERHRAIAILNEEARGIHTDHRKIRETTKGNITAAITPLLNLAEAKAKGSKKAGAKAAGSKGESAPMTKEAEKVQWLLTLLSAPWQRVHGETTTATFVQAVQYLVDNRGAIAQGEEVDRSKVGVLTMMRTAAAWKHDPKNWQAQVPATAAIAVTEWAFTREEIAKWLDPVLVEFRKAIVDAVRSRTKEDVDKANPFVLWDMIPNVLEQAQKPVPEWIAKGELPQRRLQGTITNSFMSALGRRAQRGRKAVPGATQATGEGSSKAKGKGKARAKEANASPAELVAQDMDAVERAFAILNKQVWLKAVTSAETRKAEQKMQGFDKMMYDALLYTWKVRFLSLFKPG